MNIFGQFGVVSWRRSRVYPFIIFIIVLILLSLLSPNPSKNSEKKTQGNEKTQVQAPYKIRIANELVRPNVDTTMIQSLDACKSNPNTSALAIVVIICQAEDIKLRNQVRSHWNGWFSKKKSLQSLVRRVFFIGLPSDNDIDSLQEEADKYNDIVLDVMVDTYKALSLKTLRILKWFLKHCTETGATFLVKADIDVLIHLPNLVTYLQSLEEREVEIFIGGDVSEYSEPYSDAGHRWYIPPNVLESVGIAPGSPYPPYIFGGFYVLNTPLVSVLFEESLRLPLIHLEDVFLTGVVAHKNLGYGLFKIPNIFNLYHSESCLDSFTKFNYNDKFIACHFNGRTDLLDFYNQKYQKRYLGSDVYGEID